MVAPSGCARRDIAAWGCRCRDVQIGDIVTVGECRPLSKTVRFNVLKVTKAAGTKKQFQKF